MSLLSFIKKIITGIASLFGSLPSDVKNAIALAVTVTENIKNVMDSPVVDIITTVIPGDADDAIVAALRSALPKILTGLQLTENCINSTDPDTLVQCGLQTLNKITGDAKSSFLHSISVLLAQVAAGGKLAWKDGVYLLEWYYTTSFKPAVN
jgi:hypothetical protein